MKLRVLRFTQLGLLSLLIAACGSEAPPAAKLPEVLVAQPLTRDVADQEEYSGRFEAVEMVEVRPRVSGMLQGIHFTDGQTVTKGKVLFTIDQRPFASKLAQAQARVRGAQAALDNATTELDRGKALIDRGFISHSQLDSLLATQRAAAASLAEAKAVEETAKLDLSFTRIAAPVNGRISYHRLAPGNLVTAEQSLLTTIVTQDPIRFVFDAPEAALLKFRRAGSGGGEVSIRLEDETEYRWDGRFETLDNALDQGSGTIRGQALVRNPSGLLTPGMFGRMRWTVGKPAPALLIPDEAILIDQTRPVVFVVGKDDVIQQRVVERGDLVDGLRIIRKGISPDDRVVVTGMQRARAGVKVLPKPGKIEQFPAGVTRGSAPELGDTQ